MSKAKIALVVDSCADVPISYLEKYDMKVLPLKVIKDGIVYEDGVNISAADVNAQIADHDFKTSLPSGEDILNMFNQLKDQGYTQILMITISSGLSGTYNFASLLAADFDGVTIEVMDSLSIGIGIGLQAIYAGELIEQGIQFNQVVKKIKAKVKDSSVFFCLATLEYLKKGGRIGKVQALLGQLFDLKPIISFDETGAYTTIAKVRNHKQSLRKTVELAVAKASQFKTVRIGLAYSVFNEEVEYVKQLLLEKVETIQLFIETQVSPVLVVHTGPGLVGLAVYGID